MNIALLPAPPAIAPTNGHSDGTPPVNSHPVITPFTLAEPGPDLDRLADLHRTCLAKEQQLALFAAQADREAHEAHNRAISLNAQYRLAKAARLALEGH